MTVTAFVPARSGSKRLAGKNIKDLAGKPLVIWTLEAVMQSSKVDRVIFSTDSIEYWDLAKNYFDNDKLSLDYRTDQEAGDKVKIFDYLVGAREKIFSEDDDIFLLALPTIPLRTTAQVDEAITLFATQKKPVFSATEYGFSINFAFHCEEEGNWKPVLSASPLLTGNTRSQDQKTAYHPNGAIYVRKISDLKDKELKTLYQNAIPYFMDRNTSVDIDNEIDFIVAKALAEASRAGK
ncbi:cytidylyltransferase domain-containing protein [Kiloniella sp.]|uniref:acylneuraminate cytidylyltransferase family protein n=1 Tax=Kiloniella sp. TaxID=1938587 RepID=UPI003A8EA91C